MPDAITAKQGFFKSQKQFNFILSKLFQSTIAPTATPPHWHCRSASNIMQTVDKEVDYMGSQANRKTVLFARYNLAQFSTI